MIRVDRKWVFGADYAFLYLNSTVAPDIEIKLDPEVPKFAEGWKWCWDAKRRFVYCVECDGMELLFPGAQRNFALLHRLAAHVVTRARGETRAITRVTRTKPFDYRIASMVVRLEGDEAPASSLSTEALEAELARRKAATRG